MRKLENKDIPEGVKTMLASAFAITSLKSDRPTDPKRAPLEYGLEHMRRMPLSDRRALAKLLLEDDPLYSQL